jgi:CHAD domain-containing protein
LPEWHTACTISRVGSLNSASANAALNDAIVEQLARCLAGISTPSESSTERVHSARKCLKRLRALLALRARQKHLERDGDAFRLVARSLGRVRDAAALAQTWSTAGERVSEPARSVIAAVLAQHQANLSSPEREAQRLKRAEQVLSAIHGYLALKLADEPNQSAKQLRRAARTSYGRARRMLRRVAADANLDSLHALRRATKRHQYQLQFLEPLWHGPLKAQRQELAHLSELLGTHRDLSAIEELLTRDESDALRALDGVWREQLQQWRGDLLASALGLARTALSESPHGFEARLHGLFRAAQG